jgi:hypothetical protein
MTPQHMLLEEYPNEQPSWEVLQMALNRKQTFTIGKLDVEQEGSYWIVTQDRKAIQFCESLEAANHFKERLECEIAKSDGHTIPTPSPACQDAS